jgi:hypothetical protein
MKILFGSTDTATIIDDNGSTIETEESYSNGLPVSPMRKTYNIRVKVNNQKEEHEEYVKFSDQVCNDKTMLKPVFTIERPNGRDYYYVVKSYMILEY